MEVASKCKNVHIIPDEIPYLHVCVCACVRVCACVCVCGNVRVNACIDVH